MRLDLDQLKAIHSLLPRTTADEYTHRAALALQRRHAPGVDLHVRVDDACSRATLVWARRAATGAEVLDAHRVTEDAAEVIALILAHAHRGWVVRRRLQREERADWLLRDAESGMLVALEVSGTDDGDVNKRSSEKLAQVSEAEAAPVRAACVVRFLEPMAVLQLVHEVSP
jgi:hypothetical protein